MALKKAHDQNKRVNVYVTEGRVRPCWMIGLSQAVAATPADTRLRCASCSPDAEGMIASIDLLRERRVTELTDPPPLPL
jgi:hypothetical protein